MVLLFSVSYNIYTGYVPNAQGSMLAVYSATGGNSATIALGLKEPYKCRTILSDRPLLKVVSIPVAYKQKPDFIKARTLMIYRIP